LLKNNAELSHCDKTVVVDDKTAPTLTCVNPTSSTVNCPTTAESQFVAQQATDACSTPPLFPVMQQPLAAVHQIILLQERGLQEMHVAIPLPAVDL
jgi:hypothetical protein